MDSGREENESGEIGFECGTNLVVVDGDTHLTKVIPMRSKATTEYAAAGVKQIINALCHIRLVLRTDGVPTVISVHSTESKKSC